MDWQSHPPKMKFLYSCWVVPQMLLDINVGRGIAETCGVGQQMPFLQGKQVLSSSDFVI